jgi:hypothetical protein
MWVVGLMSLETPVVLLIFRRFILRTANSSEG